MDKKVYYVTLENGKVHQIRKNDFVQIMTEHDTFKGYVKDIHDGTAIQINDGARGKCWIRFWEIFQLDVA